MSKLVLSRKEYEEFVIFLPDGREVVVRVVDIDRGKVRVAVMADSDIRILRRELIPVPAEAS